MADFWTLLLNLESGLTDSGRPLLTEADALQHAESSLQVLAALSGLAQENMNRASGWRFLDMGRRVERGINTCRFARTLSDADATTDDLDLLPGSARDYRGGYHEGIDFPLSFGMPVAAAKAGKIIRIDSSYTEWSVDEQIKSEDIGFRLGFYTIHIS